MRQLIRFICWQTQIVNLNGFGRCFSNSCWVSLSARWWCRLFQFYCVSYWMETLSTQMCIIHSNLCELKEQNNVLKECVCYANCVKFMASLQPTMESINATRIFAWILLWCHCRRNLYLNQWITSCAVHFDVSASSNILSNISTCNEKTWRSR